MTFLAPAFLIAGGIAALAVVGLHFLMTREPRVSPFPTVRFVPRTPMRAAVTALRLTDLPLMLLRIGIVLLIAISLAQPRMSPSRAPVRRIVAVDVSRAVLKDAAWRDLVAKHTNGAAAAVVFDSKAREVEPTDIRAQLSVPSFLRGSLSAALITSFRVAGRVRDEADELALVVLSPLVAEERDAATLAIRALWPGRLDLVRTKAVPRAPDPSHAAKARVEWAEVDGHGIWLPRSPPDVLGGIRASDATLIHSFQRRWRLKEPMPAGARVLARWIDGAPAAIERLDDVGGTCLRSIGFSLPKAGDAALRPDFVRFLRSLETPCGEALDLAPLSKDFIRALTGTGGLAQSAAIKPRVLAVTPLMPWLLSAALVLLVIELVMRRRCRVRDPILDAGRVQNEPGSRQNAA